jgi:hypothetical protein
MFCEKSGSRVRFSFAENGHTIDDQSVSIIKSKVAILDAVKWFSKVLSVCASVWKFQDISTIDGYHSSLLTTLI